VARAMSAPLDVLWCGDRHPEATERGLGAKRKDGGRGRGRDYFEADMLAGWAMTRTSPRGVVARERAAEPGPGGSRCIPNHDGARGAPGALDRSSLEDGLANGVTGGPPPAQAARRYGRGGGS